MPGNPEVISLFFELVPTNALVLTGLANFRVVGNSEIMPAPYGLPRTLAVTWLCSRIIGN
jgi:hypothetical protein